MCNVYIFPEVCFPEIQDSVKYCQNNTHVCTIIIKRFSLFYFPKEHLLFIPPSFPMQEYILSNPEALLNVPMPFFFFFLFTQSPVVKTETISFSSVPAGGESLEISTKEVPVVHTETKTITYESSQVRNSA